MKFFLDNNIAPHHADGLLGFAQRDGHEIEHLRKRFGQSCKDPEWIEALGKEGQWIVLSGDPNIVNNPANKKAWLESGLTGFFFANPWMRDNYWVQAHSLVRWFPIIAKQAMRTPAGHGFLLPKKGEDAKLLFPK